MTAWASDPISDLRTFLSDGPHDHIVKRKKLFPTPDGTSTAFYTFDDRLLAGSLVAYVNDVVVAATLTDPISGAITLAKAPASGTLATADYYYQWILDAELTTFLSYAYSFVSAADATQVSEGLKIAVLQQAGSSAWMKLASHWVERAAHKFLVEDEPAKSEAEARAVHFSDLAGKYAKLALASRQSFYRLRQDSGYAPAFGRTLPSIQPWTPRR